MVHYRLFTAPGAERPHANFEQMCRAALGNKDASGAALWERVTDRLQTLDQTDERQVLLNKVADLSTAVFGEMCLIERKGLQALLELKASSVELSDLTVAQIYALQERGAPSGSHFVRGMAYWMAIANHVFFVRIQNLTSDHMQNYFAWLLKDELTKAGAKTSVRLQAEFDKSLSVEDLGDIRTLRVKGNSTPQFEVRSLPDDSTKETKTSKKFADKFVQFAQALPVVEALFGPARTRSLVESLGPNEYLAVDASVKVRGSRTVKSRDSLRSIASDLADLTDGEVRVEGKDGTMSDGDAILRTRMPFDLTHEGSNYLDFDNVADQLQEVYSRFVRDQKIEA
jgi:hypothetical protein